MTGPLGTRGCSLIYRDKLGARPVRSELIYLLVSLEQYTAENRDGPWEFITRPGFPVASSHLARLSASRSVQYAAVGLAISACRINGAKIDSTPISGIDAPSNSRSSGVRALIGLVRQADLCITVLHRECSLLPPIERGLRVAPTATLHSETWVVVPIVACCNRQDSVAAGERVPYTAWLAVASLGGWPG